MLKKRLLLSLALKNKLFYKIYLYYNLYIRNFKYIFKKSYSQFNDDIFIKKFFKNKTVGTYVDIGCHHPFKLNNTYLLYKKGWNGLNIDLMKINIDLFNIWRPGDKNICSAVSNKNKISLYRAKCPHCMHVNIINERTTYSICGYNDIMIGYDWEGCGRDWCVTCGKKLCKKWLELNW